MNHIRLFEELDWKIDKEEITNILQDFIDDGYDIKIKDAQLNKVIKITLTIFVDWERISNGPLAPTVDYNELRRRHESMNKNSKNAKEARKKCLEIRDDIYDRLVEFGFDPNLIEKDNNLQPIPLTDTINPKYRIEIRIFKDLRLPH